jgi:hypothetical protein
VLNVGGSAQAIIKVREKWNDTAIEPVSGHDRIANGKIVEHWSELDNLGVLRQLGVVPHPKFPTGADRNTSFLEQNKRNTT